jgi:hypothetical protein
MNLVFKHLDLREIEGRLDPMRPNSAMGRSYMRTAPGQADFATQIVALVLKQFWEKNPAHVVRLAEIENHPGLPKGIEHLFAAALKRLARIKQLKLDFDREGVLIKPGSAWIET